MGGAFPTTRWSLVLAAADEAPDARQEAMAQLSQAYWYPLFAFARRKGCTIEEAEDLIQAYFARLIENRIVASASPGNGRFRTFLLTTMTRFMANEYKRENAQKRGGTAATVPLDLEWAEKRYPRALTSRRTPEAEFERSWALTVVDRVLERLEKDAEASGRAREFECLRGVLTEGVTATPYRQIAEELGTSEGAVKVAVHRLRHRFADTLREEIADIVAHPRDVDDEIRHLFETLTP